MLLVLLLYCTQICLKKWPHQTTDKLFPFYYVTLHYFATVFVLIKLVTDGKSVISCGRGHKSVIKEYIGGGVQNSENSVI